MKVLGVFGGIGSMMIGAKKQGYDVIGNIENRKPFFTGTYEYNFPGTFFVKSVDELTPEQRESCKNVDLIIGHPKCGSFSSMRLPTKNVESDKKQSAKNFGLFVQTVKEFTPKFFAIDNLPKSLTEFTYENWKEYLPDYDIFFEYISNGNYGNPQKRKRLFVIGARKDLGFYFIPGEFEHYETVIQRIGDIPKDAPNHQQWKLTDKVEGWWRYNVDPSFKDYGAESNRLTYEEFIELILKKQKVGQSIRVLSKKGYETKRIGKCVVDVNKPAHAVTGGSVGHHYNFRNDTFMPFTIRERARIQGCPDDFVFIPNKENELNVWHNNLVQQTGKFMPVEFTTFLTQQIKDFLEGNRDDSTYTDKRMVKPNIFIDENKYKYCQKFGYTNQEKVCFHCGSKEYCNAMKAGLCVQKLDIEPEEFETEEFETEE